MENEIMSIDNEVNEVAVEEESSGLSTGTKTAIGLAAIVGTAIAVRTIRKRKPIRRFKQRRAAWKEFKNGYDPDDYDDDYYEDADYEEVEEEEK